MADGKARRWLAITVTAPSDLLAEAVAEGLLALGGSAVEERAEQLTTYVEAPADLDAWLAQARGSLRDITGDPSVDLEWHWQSDEDWAETWKRGLRPRRVGRRFLVTPSWHAPEADHLLVIIVDPEMAFGTGEHATTRSALRCLEDVVRPGASVLDVGTGSAILAIGAARLGAAEVVAVDNDADAILNARDNLERNQVAHVVLLEQALVDDAYLAAVGPGRFDIIAANVLSSVLVPLLPSFAVALRPQGHVILGGILEEEADDVIDACVAAGFRVVREDLEEEWWGVLLDRPQPESH